MKHSLKWVVLPGINKAHSSVCKTLIGLWNPRNPGDPASLHRVSSVCQTITETLSGMQVGHQLLSATLLRRVSSKIRGPTLEKGSMTGDFQQTQGREE